MSQDEEPQTPQVSSEEPTIAPPTYTCPFCTGTKPFKTRHTCLAHIFESAVHPQHNDHKLIQCGQPGCTETFYTDFLYQIHFRKVHEDNEWPFQCQWCPGIVYKKAGFLEGHIDLHHGDRVGGGLGPFGWDADEDVGMGMKSFDFPKVKKEKVVERRVEGGDGELGDLERDLERDLFGVENEGQNESRVPSRKGHLTRSGETQTTRHAVEDQVNASSNSRSQVSRVDEGYKEFQCPFYDFATDVQATYMVHFEGHVDDFIEGCQRPRQATPAQQKVRPVLPKPATGSVQQNVTYAASGPVDHMVPNSNTDAQDFFGPTLYNPAPSRPPGDSLPVTE
ncbi:hypothetical protein B0J14DRAFT_671758 [Halenospora varia]|nr:hypothetical protein B0J14DRAFT_671758 [Halenospora varia]